MIIGSKARNHQITKDMKRVSFFLYFSLLVMVMLLTQTCRKDELSPEEKINQQEKKIIDKINDFMPDELVALYETSFSNLRSEEEYALYLDSLDIAIDELKDAIQLNFSLTDYKKALATTFADINNSTKGDGCLGLGYAKGVSVETSVSGTIGALVVAGLQASGGGGVKVVYDFVNMEREIYCYTICSYGFSIGVGIAAEMNLKLGFSGINEVITGIRYHGPIIVKNSFDGQSIGMGLSVGGEFAAIGGISLSGGFGVSKSANADFEGIVNLLPCPHNMIEIVNARTSYSIKVTGSIKAVAGADLMAIFSANEVGTNTFGIRNSYTKFHETRTIAGTKMAKEIIIPNPMVGIVAFSNPIDMFASSAALVYSLKDPSKCPPEKPSVGTRKITNVSSSGAAGGGFVKEDFGINVSDRGVCWDTSPNPTISNSHTDNGGGTGSFLSILNGLIPSTIYYVRAYATNSAGTTYGTQVSFTTSSGQTGTFTDIEGNIYNIVTIGTQKWMAENLKVTQYNNGIRIPRVDNYSTWNGLSTGAYCLYNNDNSYFTKYGLLYNWYAIDTKNLCPSGWHVPSKAEWTTLSTFLIENGYGYGGSGPDIGKSMAATSGWAMNSTVGVIGYDQASNNSSGFTAVPGGFRDLYGGFHMIQQETEWWTSTPSTEYEGSAIGFNLWCGGGFLTEDYMPDKNGGASVRCVKD